MKKKEKSDKMQRCLTSGPITKGILLFALPLMLGNLLQQMYNIADTWVVGRFLGPDALAAVGSSYTLMTFLTSILLGLCMGSGAAISMQYGSGEHQKMRQSVFLSFTLIAGISLVLNVLVYLGLDGILWVLRVPEELKPLMKEYLVIIFLGITATFLYNYFANLLRAIGNSVVPLLFLAVSAVLNVLLDLVCVLVLHWGVRGAAAATTFSHLDFAGAVHGQRRGHLHAVRQRGTSENAAERVSFVHPHCGHLAGAERAGVPRAGWHPLGAAGAGGAEAPDEGIPRHHLSGHYGYLFI